jgi:hypothetical protein
LPGLGAELEEEIHDALGLIAAMPEAWDAVTCPLRLAARTAAAFGAAHRGHLGASELIWFPQELQ